MHSGGEDRGDNWKKDSLEVGLEMSRVEPSLV